MADGYISDVPSRVSNSPSDISNDLIQSTQALEKNFKDRYKVLKTTYESRLKQLTGVISDACSHIVDDDIVKEMKSDATSVTFLPAHICEIVENFLNSDRESLVRQLIAKNTVLEGDLRKSKNINEELREKLNSMEAEVSKGRRAELQVTALTNRTAVLQREFEELTKQTEADVGNLEADKKALEAELNEALQNVETVMERLSAKSSEYEELRNMNENKERDLRSIEESFEQSTRELVIMEEVEKRDRQQYESLKSQYESITKDFTEVSNHCNELKLKLQASHDEIGRNKIIFDKLAQEEDSVKGHIAHLMATVERLLAEEAKESNETLLIMHRKMKSAKEKFSIELNKEKRMLKGVQDEVVALRSTRDDQHRQITHLHEQCSEFRDKASREHERYNASQLSLQESNKQMTDLRVKIKDMETNERVLLEKLRDIDKIKETELRLHGEKVKIEYEKSLEHEKFHLEKRNQAFRLHYENELTLVQQNVRNSFDSMTRSSGAQNHQLDANEVAMSIDNAIRAAKENWMLERARLESEHSAKISRVQVEVGRQYTQRLQEADDNIERLKNIVKEKLQLLQNQNEVIESMQREAALVDLNASLGASNGKQGLFSAQSKVHRYGNKIDNIGASNDWSADDGREDGGSQRSFSAAQMRDNGGRLANNNSNNNSINNNSSNNNSNTSKIDASQLSKLLQDYGVAKEQNRELEAKVQALESENQSLNEDRETFTDQQMRDTETMESMQKALDSMQKKFQTLMLLHENEKNLNRSRNDSLNIASSVSSSLAKSSVEGRNLLNTTLDLNDSLDVDRSSEDTYDDNADNHGSESDDSEDRKHHDSTDVRENFVSKLDQAVIHSSQNDSTTIFETSLAQRYLPGSAAEAKASMRSDKLTIADLEDKVARQEHEIQKLENQLLLQKELLKAAQSESAIERNKASDLAKQITKTNSILYTIDKTYRTQLTQMRVVLNRLRGDVEQADIQLEAGRTMRAIRVVIDQAFAKTNETLDKSMAKLTRTELTNAHSTEMKILEEKYLKKYNELSLHYKDAIESSKKDIMAKTESALSSHKSLSNLPSYESAINGLLEGLMQNGVIARDQYTYVIDLAKKHSEPSYSASSMAKSMISECIIKLHNAHSEAINHIEAEYNQVKEENTSLKERVSNADWNVDDSYSTLSGSDLNAKSGDRCGNLSQSERMLAGLSKIESESRLRSLQDEIEDIRSFHAIELQRLKTDRGDIESKVRKTLEEELVSLRANEKSKQVALEAELREERNKRLRLQTSLSEVESDFESTVENLEMENKALLAKLSSLGS